MDERQVREFLLLLGERLLWTALDRLRLARVRLTQELVTSSRQWVIRYGLNSQDALHFAIARRIANEVGIEPHLATLDDDFDVVDGLHVWGRGQGRLLAPRHVRPSD